LFLRLTSEEQKKSATYPIFAKKKISLLKGYNFAAMSGGGGELFPVERGGGGKLGWGKPKTSQKFFSCSFKKKQNF